MLLNWGCVNVFFYFNFFFSNEFSCVSTVHIRFYTWYILHIIHFKQYNYKMFSGAMLDFVFYFSLNAICDSDLCRTWRKFRKYNNAQLCEAFTVSRGFLLCFSLGISVLSAGLNHRHRKCCVFWIFFFSSRQFPPMCSLNPGIWSHNWLSKSLSRQREPRWGTSTCVLLQAGAMECNAQSCTIYGPWTVYKKQCSLSERGTEDGWESFQSRKLSFRIICAMMKMFPPWRKMAGSTNGHLYPNQKRSCHNYSVSSSASCGMFTLLSIRSVSKTVWNLQESLKQCKLHP